MKLSFDEKGAAEWKATFTYHSIFAPREQPIRVHYEPPMIEFRNCRFWTSFWRRRTIESYLCPLTS
jgi:hypothetical protein